MNPAAAYDANPEGDLARIALYTAGNALIHETTFDFDDNGNLLSLAPPGQPAHEMAYNTADLEVSYTPPQVDEEDPLFTAWSPDKRPEFVTRPDGNTIDLVWSHRRLDKLVYFEGAISDYQSRDFRLPVPRKD